MSLSVRAVDGAYLDGFVWFSNFHSNGLFRINVISKRLEFVDFFPGESIDSFFLHKRCFAYNGKLIFLPAQSKNIIVYDVLSKMFDAIPLGIEIEGEAIIDAVRINSNIIMFPKKSKCTPLVFDINLQSIKIEKEFADLLDMYVDADMTSKFFRVCENDGCIYMPLKDTDLIGEWNIKTGKFVVNHTNCNKIINILVKDKKCYFSLREEYGLMALDFESGEIKKYDCDVKNNKNANVYGCLSIWGNYIIASPGYGEHIHIFDDGLVFDFKMPKKESDDYYFFRNINVGEDIWFLPMGINAIYVLSKDKVMESFDLVVEKK